MTDALFSTKTMNNNKNDSRVYVEVGVSGVRVKQEVGHKNKMGNLVLTIACDDQTMFKFLGGQFHLLVRPPVK